MNDMPTLVITVSENGQHNDWRLNGAVFDCDGLLIDSESIWLEMLTEWMTEHMSVDPLPLDRFHGLTVVDTARLLFDHSTGKYQDPLVLQQAITERYSSLLAEGVSLMPGAKELLSQLHHRVPLALASNGLRQDVVTMLESTGILSFFDAVCTLDDVERGKPHPDIYQLACERLSVDTTVCVAFEDSPTGVQAAKSAGMTVIGVSASPDIILPSDGRASSLEHIHIIEP